MGVFPAASGKFLPPTWRTLMSADVRGWDGEGCEVNLVDFTDDSWCQWESIELKIFTLFFSLVSLSTYL